MSKLQFRNARTVIAQIRAGEWKRINEWKVGWKHNGECVWMRNGQELWVRNGPFFCDLYPNRNAFGFLWRHWVWWAAIRPRLKRINSVPDLSAVTR